MPRRDGTIPDVVVTQQRPAGLIPAHTIELLIEIWSLGNTDRERVEKRSQRRVAVQYRADTRPPVRIQRFDDGHGPARAGRGPTSGLRL